MNLLGWAIVIPIGLLIQEHYIRRGEAPLTMGSPEERLLTDGSWEIISDCCDPRSASLHQVLTFNKGGTAQVGWPQKRAPAYDVSGDWLFTGLSQRQWRVDGTAIVIDNFSYWGNLRLRAGDSPAHWIREGHLVLRRDAVPLPADGDRDVPALLSQGAWKIVDDPDNLKVRGIWTFTRDGKLAIDKRVGILSDPAPTQWGVWSTEHQKLSILSAEGRYEFTIQALSESELRLFGYRADKFMELQQRPRLIEPMRSKQRLTLSSYWLPAALAACGATICGRWTAWALPSKGAAFLVALLATLVLGVVVDLWFCTPPRWFVSIETRQLLTLGMVGVLVGAMCAAAVPAAVVPERTESAVAT